MDGEHLMVIRILDHLIAIPGRAASLSAVVQRLGIRAAGNPGRIHIAPLRPAASLARADHDRVRE